MTHDEIVKELNRYLGMTSYLKQEVITAAIEAMQDKRRMDWLEQQKDCDLVSDLIIDWKFEGKRYATGVRDAIDEAMK